MRDELINKLFSTQEKYEEFISKHKEVVYENKFGVLRLKNVKIPHRLILNLETFDFCVETIETKERKKLTLDPNNSGQMTALRLLTLDYTDSPTNTIMKLSVEGKPELLNNFLLDIAKFGLSVNYIKDDSGFGGTWLGVEVHKRNKELSRTRPNIDAHFKYSLSLKLIIPERVFNSLSSHLYDKGWRSECLGNDGHWMETWIHQIGKNPEDFLYKKTDKFELKEEFKIDYELNQKIYHYNYKMFQEKKKGEK